MVALVLALQAVNVSTNAALAFEVASARAGFASFRSSNATLGSAIFQLQSDMASSISTGSGLATRVSAVDSLTPSSSTLVTLVLALQAGNVSISTALQTTNEVATSVLMQLQSESASVLSLVSAVQANVTQLQLSADSVQQMTSSLMSRVDATETLSTIPAPTLLVSTMLALQAANSSTYLMLGTHATQILQLGAANNSTQAVTSALSTRLSADNSVYSAQIAALQAANTSNEFGLLSLTSRVGALESANASAYAALASLQTRDSELEQSNFTAFSSIHTLSELASSLSAWNSSAFSAIASLGVLQSQTSQNIAWLSTSGDRLNESLTPITAWWQVRFTTAQPNIGGVSAYSLSAPTALTVDASGNVYLADEPNHRVLYYESGFTIATRVYGQGGSFTSRVANNGGVSARSLYLPRDVALDASGNVYVVDSGNHRVLYYVPGSTTATRMYGQGGSFTSNVVNNGGVSADSLWYPYGVTVDASGNVYVADNANHRVLYYESGSTTAARVYGQGGNFTSNVAGGVSANSLCYPWRVALDASGNVYVADNANHRGLYYVSGSTTATRVYGQM